MRPGIIFSSPGPLLPPTISSKPGMGAGRIRDHFADDHVIRRRQVIRFESSTSSCSARTASPWRVAATRPPREREIFNQQPQPAVDVQHVRRGGAGTRVSR